MKWRDNSTHPEPLTECLCEYTDTQNGSHFYIPLIAYPEGTWLTGIAYPEGTWLTESAIVYNKYEITKWCPLDEIAEFLNKESE